MLMRLSFSAQTRQWLLENFALGIKNYWFTFIADSSTALFFLLWQIHARHSHPASVAVACIGGYLAWTLSEYAFHRWVYHQENGIYGDGHRRHHEDAQILIAMPWFVTTIVMFTLWYLCAEALRIPFFSAILAGWLAGFVWYSVVHHGHHHWTWRTAWMRKLKAYHRVHHQIPSCNYGVTMRFWDSVFGTRFRKVPTRDFPETDVWASKSEDSEAVSIAAET